VDGKLNYQFSDAKGTQIGTGTFTVNGTAGQPSTFNASLTFNPPAAGGTVHVSLYDRNAAGVTLTSISIDLYVAPPQAITIETPAAGTVVGSPVVITGRLARYPFGGKLGYRVVETAGRQLGANTIPVSGTLGRPTTFSGSLIFDAPEGTTIRVELF